PCSIEGGARGREGGRRRAKRNAGSAVPGTGVWCVNSGRARMEPRAASTVRAAPLTQALRPMPTDTQTATDYAAVARFLRHHYRHFNAAALVDAAEGYRTHLDGGGRMLVSLAGAMSTAELGLSLAEMIRQDKVHIISCTGANLEEDLFNLVAHDYYERVPHYRELTAQQEQELLERHMNRVTDTAIPEMEAMRRLETAVLEEWVDADSKGERYFPHEFMYRVI